MKKLIGLLGAAGLLIPSAAMAGSIGNSSGTDALRTTAASYANQTVTVDSNIYKKNDMHVWGKTSGKTTSFSAEDYVNGGGDLSYSEHDLTAQSAANLDINDLHARGKWDIYVKDVERSNDFSRKTVSEEGGSGGDGCRGGKGCKTSKSKGGKGGRPSRGSETETVKRDRSKSRDVLDTDGEFTGSADGSADYAATLDTQTSVTLISGGEADFINGAFSESFDKYSGGYKGDLYEEGRTKTHVEADTVSVATSNGFESGHFNNTEWN
ncbi:hypothetical protein [Synechococcus sp. Cu2B8-bc1011]|uniref:hypothetical protein n=1 Tax=Synechococcus sp. Cu2B8-bc1011 TaxID=3093725 RepID=UPI0039AF0434